MRKCNLNKHDELDEREICGFKQYKACFRDFCKPTLLQKKNQLFQLINQNFVVDHFVMYIFLERQSQMN